VPAGEEGGAAAAKARELIAELSGQSAPAIPSQSAGGPALPPAPPGSPATPYASPGSPVPSFGGDPGAPIPSYAPQEPPGLGFTPAEDAAGPEAPSAGQWSPVVEEPPAGPLLPRGLPASGEPLVPDQVEDHARDDHSAKAGGRRLPLLLLLLVLVVGGGYLVKTHLLDSSSGDTTTTAPPVHASARISPPATVPGRLSPAALAASLQDPHFKHGYEAGKAKAPVATADREQTCRTMALAQRAQGYPWGAHDRAGCLVALAG
jgi:hypothetical protein